MTIVIGLIGSQMMTAKAGPGNKGWGHDFNAQDYKVFDKRHRGCNEALVSGVYGFNARGFVATDPVGHEPSMIEDDKRQAGTGLAEFRKDGTATFTIERFFTEGVTDQPR